MIFSVDTLQIYFPASLEIQEELINHGFKIPANESGKIKTPIPLIYANSRRWLKDEEPITIERLIPPEWLKNLLTTLDGRKSKKVIEEHILSHQKM